MPAFVLFQAAPHVHGVNGVYPNTSKERAWAPVPWWRRRVVDASGHACRPPVTTHRLTSHGFQSAYEMDSVSSKKGEDERRQADIRRQIALLQAQLDDGDTSQPLQETASPRRKRPSPSGGVLIPETPSSMIQHRY